MIAGRVIGALLFLVGLAALLRDLLVLADTGHWAPLSFGAWWRDIDRASLDLAHRAVERWLPAAAWDPVVTTLLALWVCVVLIVAGGAIFILCRPRPRRFFAS
jgi:hypothetical protein